MKKIFLIIFINIAAVIVLFFAADAASYRILSNEKFNLINYINSYKLMTFEETIENHWKFRDALKPESRKRPLLLFGCSFAYGWGLEDEQTFAYKLSELTDRSVYNRSYPSTGIQYFLYMLQHFNLEKEVKNPEYIIYMLIDDHFFRLFRPYWGYTHPVIDIRYKNSQEGLKEYRSPFYQLGRTSVYRFLNTKYYENAASKPTVDERFDLVKIYFKEAQKLINEKFPDSKIVIILWEQDNGELTLSNTPRWKELKNEGFIVYNTYKLTGKKFYQPKYKIKNDEHPNAEAVNIAAEALVKKLSL